MSHILFFFLMIRRPPRSTLDRSSAASDVYKRQSVDDLFKNHQGIKDEVQYPSMADFRKDADKAAPALSLIHISEPTRPY